MSESSESLESGEIFESQCDDTTLVDFENDNDDVDVTLSKCFSNINKFNYFTITHLCFDIVLN